MQTNEIVRFNEAHNKFQKAFDYFLGFHAFPFVKTDKWNGKIENNGERAIVYAEPKEGEERTLAFFVEKDTKAILIYSYSLGVYYSRTLIGMVEDDKFKEEIVSFVEECRKFRNWEKVNEYFTSLS
nr:MAG TPA: hypothetical protein [Caudoviricetes sp.]